MPAPSFRFVCLPSALTGAPAGWALEMLRDGEIALLAAEHDFRAVSALAHELELLSVPLVRGEDSAGRQADTVIAYADGLPLVWVQEQFDDHVWTWARARGPMTLLVETSESLSDDERRRIDRFVAILTRQSE